MDVELPGQTVRLVLDVGAKIQHGGKGQPDRHERAVLLTWSHWSPTVADLAAAVGIRTDTIWVDGRVCLADELIDGLDLHDGSVITDVEPPLVADQEVPGEAALVIEQLAGCAAGAELRVSPGAISAQPVTWRGPSSGMAELGGPPPMSDPTPTPAVAFELMSGPASDQRNPHGPLPRWHPGGLRMLGDDLFILRAGDSDGAPDGPGVGLIRRSRVVHRSPRLPRADAVEPVHIPAVPTEPSPPPRLSWAVMIAPLPIGILIAVLFRPMFLLFTALGPVMAFGRWTEGRIRYRRDCVRWRAELLAIETATAVAIDAAAQAYAEQRRGDAPTLAAIVRRARGAEVGLWERRPDHDDFGQVVVGYHDRQWTPPVVDAPSDAASTGSASTVVRNVPLTLRFGTDSVVGVVGPRSQRQSVARSLVVQLAGLHGPADLSVVMGTGGADHRDECDQWEWCKWLPHLRRSVDPGAQEDCLTVALGGLIGPGAALVLAETVEALPARCTQIVVLDAGRARVLDLERGQTMLDVVPVGCSERFANALARELAPACDGDLRTGVVAPPSLVALEELVVVRNANDVAEQWAKPEAQTSATLTTTLGSDGTPIAVDLVADGPHALIAGTTGSGKSELLRTLVSGLALHYPPDRCLFVLIDFKGGGAFDLLAPLAHVASVVTDLDEGIAERALRSLRAELRAREEYLRLAGASDLSDCPTTDETPPRLVIVVDEFATLASEAPEFLDGLIDTAQRGRSLGVHLVLATQRPAGVVDNRIRANTNLRICLRVGGAADSRDVIDTDDAARLPTAAIGRAWLRVGSESPRLFQCAHVGRGPRRPEPGRMHVAPFTLVTASGLGGEPVGGFGSRAVGRDSPLVDILAEAGQDFGSGSFGPPWLAPLAEALGTEDLWGSGWVDPEVFPIGRCDLPDERSQPVWSWCPAQGALAVIGGTDRERSAVSRLIEQAVMQRLDLHGTPTSGIVVIGRPHEGARRVDPTDVERVGRALDWFSAQRTDVGAGAPVLVIEDHARLGGDSDQRERTELLERVSTAISGADARALVVVMAANERVLPTRLVAGCAQRLVLALADVTAFAALGIRLRTLPQMGYLGAKDLATGGDVRLATPTTSHAVKSPSVDVAPAVVDRTALRDLLPEGGTHRADFGALAGPSSAGQSVGAVVGVSLRDLAPIRVPLDGRPLLVLGDRGSGRTTTLQTLVDGARLDDGRDISVFIGRRGRADRWAHDGSFQVAGHAEIGTAAVRLGPRSLVVIDDADEVDEHFGAELVARIELAPHATLVVAGSGQLTRALRGPWAKLLDSRLGVVLGRGQLAQQIYSMRPTWYLGVPTQRGDAVLVDRDDIVAVRMARFR